MKDIPQTIGIEPVNVATRPKQGDPVSRATGLFLLLRLYPSDHIIRKGKSFKVEVILRVSYRSLSPKYWNPSKASQSLCSSSQNQGPPSQYIPLSLTFLD